MSARHVELVQRKCRIESLLSRPDILSVREEEKLEGELLSVCGAIVAEQHGRRV